jgi:hypothetical protein
LQRVEKSEYVGYSSTACLVVIALCVAVSEVDFTVYAIAGTFVSMLPCFFVIMSHYLIPRFNRHPNPILFWRAVCDFIFAFHVMWSVRRKDFDYPRMRPETSDSLRVCQDVTEQPTAEDCNGCYYHSAITQFTIMGAEAWFAALSIDLHTSMSNPFCSFKANMKKYHFGAWTLALLTTLILLFTDSYGHSNMNVCWMRRSSKVLGAAWGFFYIWLVIFGILGIAVYVESRRILSRGLASTYKTRSEIILANQRSVAIVIAYWLILALFYSIFIFPQGNNKDALSRTNPAQKFLVFLFSARGLVSAVLWFQSNSFSVFVAHIFRHGIFPQRVPSDGDPEQQFRPQVNVALRKQMIFYITRGIKRSIQLNSEEPLAPDQYRRTFLLNVDPVEASDSQTVPSQSASAAPPPPPRGSGSSSGSSPMAIAGPSNSSREPMLSVEEGDTLKRYRTVSIFDHIKRMPQMLDYTGEVFFSDFFPGLFSSIRQAFGVVR